MIWSSCSKCVSLSKINDANWSKNIGAMLLFYEQLFEGILGRIQLSSTGSNDVRFLNCRGEKEHSSVRATSNCRCINNLRRTCHSSSKACLNKTIIMNAICEHKRKLTNTCFTRTISCELFHTICHISRRCVPAAGCEISSWNQQTVWRGVACSFFTLNALFVD